MILESLKPKAVQAICQHLEKQLAHLDNQIAEIEFALLGHLEPMHRQHLEQLRASQVRTAVRLRARLVALSSVRYSDDERAVWSRTLRVA